MKKLLLASMLIASLARAEETKPPAEPPKPPQGPAGETLMGFHMVGERLVKMAEGKKPDFTDLPRDKYKSKAEVVSALKHSIDAVEAHLKSKDDAAIQKPMKHPFANAMVSERAYWGIPTGHMLDHYGQLIVYYRLNHLVPPGSK